MNKREKKVVRWLVVGYVIMMLIAINDARSDEMDFYISGLSWHQYGEFNEVNGGYGVTIRTESGPDLMAGTFLNSESLQSVYAGIELPYRLTDALTVGIDVLAVKGYRQGPFVAPIAFVEVHRVKVTIIPPSEFSPLTIGLQWRI